MAVHGYLIAILLAASVGGAADVPAGMEETPLVSVASVLADVNQLTVVLATQGMPHVEQVIDAAQLEARILQKLVGTGVRVIGRGLETTPRLVVRVEGIEVLGSNQYVFRVQTALDRLVIVPGQGNRQLLTEVWRVSPAMAVVPKPDVGNAICDAALIQVGGFAVAREAARRLFDATKDTPADGTPGRTQSAVQGSEAAATYLFVASKSSSVFHRPDCRWAQNISGDNRVTYKTREEAIASGKRPCKSCKP